MRRIAVLDAPSNLGLRPPTETSVPGVAKAPGALRDAGLLRRLRARDAGCLTPPRYDPGDWRPGDGVCHAPEIASYSVRLADRIGAIIDNGEFPIVLGGDCSVSLGSALAMRRLGESVGGHVGLVFVDGHSDFRHPGNASYVGAAAGEGLALITGRGQADLTALEGRRPYYRDIDVVVVGIRASDEYRLDLQAAGIVTRPVPALRAEGAPRSAQWALDQISDCAGFWVHIDVDVLDPAVMPAVDAPEPGGIAFTELEALLEHLVGTPHCLGMEITVFDPDYDADGSYAAEIVAMVGEGIEAAERLLAMPRARGAVVGVPVRPVSPAAPVTPIASAAPARPAAPVGTYEALVARGVRAGAAAREAASSRAARREAAVAPAPSLPAEPEPVRDEAARDGDTGVVPAQFGGLASETVPIDDAGSASAQAGGAGSVPDRRAAGVPAQGEGVDPVSARAGGLGFASARDRGDDIAQVRDRGIDVVPGRDRGTDVVPGRDRGTDVVLGRDRGTDLASGRDRGGEAERRRGRAVDVAPGRDRGVDAVRGRDRGVDVASGPDGDAGSVSARATGLVPAQADGERRDESPMPVVSNTTRETLARREAHSRRQTPTSISEAAAAAKARFAAAAAAAARPEAPAEDPDLPLSVSGPAGGVIPSPLTISGQHVDATRRTAPRFPAKSDKQAPARTDPPARRSGWDLDDLTSRSGLLAPRRPPAGDARDTPKPGGLRRRPTADEVPPAEPTTSASLAKPEVVRPGGLRRRPPKQPDRSTPGSAVSSDQPDPEDPAPAALTPPDAAVPDEGDISDSPAETEASIAADPVTHDGGTDLAGSLDSGEVAGSVDPSAVAEESDSAASLASAAVVDGPSDSAENAGSGDVPAVAEEPAGSVGSLASNGETDLAGSLDSGQDAGAIDPSALAEESDSGVSLASDGGAVTAGSMDSVEDAGSLDSLAFAGDAGSAELPAADYETASDATPALGDGDGDGVGEAPVFGGVGPVGGQGPDDQADGAGVLDETDPDGGPVLRNGSALDEEEPGRAADLAIVDAAGRDDETSGHGDGHGHGAGAGDEEPAASGRLASEPVAVSSDERVPGAEPIPRLDSASGDGLTVEDQPALDEPQATDGERTAEVADSAVEPSTEGDIPDSAVSSSAADPFDADRPGTSDLDDALQTGLADEAADGDRPGESHDDPPTGGTMVVDQPGGTAAVDLAESWVDEPAGPSLGPSAGEGLTEDGAGGEPVPPTVLGRLRRLIGSYPAPVGQPPATGPGRLRRATPEADDVG